MKPHRVKKSRQSRAAMRRGPCARSVAKTNSTAAAQPSFASLDFPGRQVIHPFEIARRIGCSNRHIYNLILEGQLRAVDISGRGGADRRAIRVPIESWRQFLTERTI